jgi:DNA-binding beta-propeller fold protein YncE
MTNADLRMARWAVVLGTAGLAACGGSAAPATCSNVPGSICSWAGTGEPAFNADVVDRRLSALYWPMDLEFAPDGRAYLLDWQNHRVRRVDADDTLETVIGTDEVGDGPTEGSAGELTDPGVPGTTVNLNHPTDIAFDADGTLILAAWHNHKIRRYDVATGLVEIACGGNPGFAGDTFDARTALLNQPKGVAVSRLDGALYLVDTRNTRVRRIDKVTNVIDTVAGGATRGYAGDGGPPLEAQFAFQKVLDNPEPGGAIAIDDADRIYVADTENQRIRRIDLAANLIETVAGNGQIGDGGDGGPALDAALNYPRDIELGAGGKLYIADTENHRVRVVDLASGIITDLVGDGTAGFAGDGGPATAARLHRPFGIALDGAGGLYIADTFNNRIRRVVLP